MSLNESKGNMYDFVTHTWNTIKGACPHECSYCYMHRWGKQRSVRFDRKELKTDFGLGRFIFVGSSCDMFASTIPREWIGETLRKCHEGSTFNQFMFQSKNPQIMATFTPRLLGVARVVCTTIETNRWYPEIMRNSPKIENRVEGMIALKPFDRFVTIEPIMDFDMEPMVEAIKRCEPRQVNIGADSGRNGLPEPPMDKVQELSERLKKFTTISNKRNLERLVKE